MNKGVKVSFITSVYNETYDELKASIKSILNQSYKNIELILINDNPKLKALNDDVEKLILGDDRVRYIKNKENMGLVYSLNVGLNYATGDYIARMDADDISSPVRIERQLEYLIKNEYDLVGAYMEKIDENGNVIGYLKSPKGMTQIKFLSNFGGVVYHPTWLGRRVLFEKLNGYREIPGCEDHDFIKRAIYHGFKLSNVPEYLLKYRIRRNGVSANSQVNQIILPEYINRNISNNIVVSEKDIRKYILSDEYIKRTEDIREYIINKNKLKNGNFTSKVLCGFKCLIYKRFYMDLFYMLVRKLYMY